MAGPQTAKVAAMIPAVRNGDSIRILHSLWHSPRIDERPQGIVSMPTLIPDGSSAGPPIAGLKPQRSRRANLRRIGRYFGSRHTTGPMLLVPDGNPILVDQHVARAK